MIDRDKDRTVEHLEYLGKKLEWIAVRLKSFGVDDYDALTGELCKIDEATSAIVEMV